MKLALLALTLLASVHAHAYTHGCLMNFQYRAVCSGPLVGHEPIGAVGLQITYAELSVTQNPASAVKCTEPVGLQKTVSVFVNESFYGSANGDAFVNGNSARGYTLTTLTSDALKGGVQQIGFSRATGALTASAVLMGNFAGDPNNHGIEQAVNCTEEGAPISGVFP